mgnify:CR=1 FL=1
MEASLHQSSAFPTPRSPRNKGTSLEREFSQAKQRYEDLLGHLSNPIPETAMSAPVYRQTPPPRKEPKGTSIDLELQMWRQMWDRIYQMAAPVVSYDGPMPKNDTDRRMVLVDLVSLLIERRSTLEVEQLREKNIRYKQRLGTLKQQFKSLTEEVKVQSRLLRDYIDSSNRKCEFRREPIIDIQTEQIAQKPQKVQRKPPVADKINSLISIVNRIQEQMRNEGEDISLSTLSMLNETISQAESEL